MIPDRKWLNHDCSLSDVALHRPERIVFLLEGPTNSGGESANVIDEKTESDAHTPSRRSPSMLAEFPACASLRLSEALGSSVSRVLEASRAGHSIVPSVAAVKTTNWMNGEGHLEVAKKQRTRYKPLALSRTASRL